MQALTDLEALTCPTCGILYAVPRRFIQNRRESPRASPGWYCPNGHALHFTETELDRVRRERDSLKQENARLDEERAAADRRAAEERRQRERIEKRAGAGVCPCCNRTVSQLARHMQSRHPDAPFVPTAKPAPKLMGAAAKRAAANLGAP